MKGRRIAKKMAQQDTKGWIAVIVMIAIGLYVISGGEIFEGAMEKIGMGTADADMDVDTSVPCLHVDDTTYTFVYDDKENAGTDPTAAADDAVAIYVWNKADQAWVKKDGSYASGDSAQLSPLSKVRIYTYDDAEDDAMVSANTFMKEFIVPCAGTLDHTIKVVDLGAAASTETEAISGMTVTILDDEYTSIKGTTAGYNIPSGAAMDVGKFAIAFPTEDGFGATNACWTFYANKTLVEKLTFSGTDVVEKDCTPRNVETPLYISAAAQEKWAFEGPALTDTLTQYGLKIDLESGQQGVDSEPNSIINFRVDDNQYFLNTETGLIELGYEDEDGNEIGAQSFGENISIGNA